MNKEGTWRISAKGVREDVVKAIDADQKIPASWKSALKDSLPNERAVRVDAHCHFAKGKHVYHVDISKLF